MKSGFKQFIESVAGPKAPGPATSFTVAHIFFALELMVEKPVGRNSLARRLEIGEGAVRTIVNRLKGCGLIVTSRQGCSLTGEGLAFWGDFVGCFPRRGEVGAVELTGFACNYAFLVRGCGEKVGSGIEQRDAAVVAGARGAVVIVSRRGRLVVEGVSDGLEERFPVVAGEILRVLDPVDGDVVVLVGASSLVRARLGAFAASWTLID